MADWKAVNFAGKGAGPARRRGKTPARGEVARRASLWEANPWEGLESRVLLSGGIQGTKFADLNGDGVRNAGEPGLAGWGIYVDMNRNLTYDAGVDLYTTTDANGNYAFAGLSAGFYQIGEVPKAGWRQTFPQVTPSGGTPSGGSASGGAPLASAPAGTGKSAGANSAQEALASPAVKAAIERASDLSLYSKKELASAREWVVGLPAGAKSAKGLAERLGASSAKRSGVLAGAFVVRYDAKSDAQGRKAITQALKRGKLEFFYPLVKTQVVKRFVPNDPMFAEQWHLNNTGQTGGTPGEDARLVSAWNTTLGAGVVIGVVDDGLEWTHEDLVGNYVAAYSYDFLDGDNDPRSSVASEMEHGTAVAGVLGARGNNGKGVSGVAPLAQLAGIRLIGGPVTDQQQADALRYFKNQIAIYNNSWGPADTGQDLEAPGPLTLAAIREGATTGRNGLGNVYVWAAGNGREYGDNVNYDGFANNRFVIAVGAIDHTGEQTSYSEPGAAMLVTAHSDSFPSPGITTTDLSGGNGSNPGDYTSTFGGTSTTTPIVSGVAALMLAANPNLTARDVRMILAKTARRNDPSDAGWTRNGAGLWVNHKYGFGAVDAAAAVTAAQNWVNVSPEDSASSGQVVVNKAVPDNNTTGISSSVFINKAVRVESVEVVFDAAHNARGDLEVVLVSPEGTESVLAEQRFIDTNPDYRSWTFSSVRHLDEVSRGTWTLKVRDLDGGTTGTFKSWQLNVYGTSLAQAAQYANVEDGETVGGRDFGNKVDTLTGTAGDDAYYVRLDPATGQTLEVFAGATPTGTPLFSFPANAVGDLAFETLGGDDRLFVEALPGRNAVPVNGILFAAGADGASGGDVLNVVGSGAFTGTYTAGTGVGGGTFAVGARPVTFTGAEGVVSAGLSGLTVVTAGSADALTIDSPAAGKNRVSGTSGGVAVVPLTFSETPVVQLDTGLNDVAGSAGDTVTIGSPGMVASGLNKLQLKAGAGNNRLEASGGVTELEALDGASLTLVARNDGTRVNLVASQQFSRLEIEDAAEVRLTAGGAKTLLVSSLQLGSAARLDLEDNDLIVQANATNREALFAHVRERIASARNSGPGGEGSWTGPGITSNAARNTLGGGTGLAAIKNTDDNVVALRTNFNGNWVGVDAILVKYTWDGDSELDGAVTADDYFRIDRGFLKRATTYRGGDFNYDNAVDLDDYLLIDAAYLGQNGVL